MKRNITEKKLWQWFLDCVDDFKFIGDKTKQPYPIWGLYDKFGNLRYTVSVESGLTRGIIYITIYCGEQIVLEKTMYTDSGELYGPILELAEKLVIKSRENGEL